MSEFKNWRVAPMTPSRVDTPDGMISVSWRSNSDNGATDMKAERAARLIAAAPGLLEALIEVRKLHQRYCDRVGASDAWATELQARVKSAIAKATGAQP